MEDMDKKGKNPKDLNQRAKSIVDAVAARSEAAPLKQMHFRRFPLTPVDQLGRVESVPQEEETHTALGR